MRTLYTVMPYHYVNACEEQTTGFITLKGVLNPQEAKMIRERLLGQINFIPDDLRLGIPCLRARVCTDLDQVFHELDLDAREVVASPEQASLAIPVDRFVQAFQTLNPVYPWDTEAEQQRMLG